jgi:myo-inositol-1-phosphate synthase
MVWAASTEIFLEESAVHGSIEAFEKGLYDSDPAIAPSMIYAYAAIKSGVPFANGAPNLTVDTPALLALAEQNRVPICGKDFKTGQTLMKTILARVSNPACSDWMDGTRQTFSAIVMVRCLTTPRTLRRKRNQNFRSLNTFFSPTFTPPSIKIFRMSSASITIRRAAT